MREPKSEVFNMDCLEFLRGCKDKQFDLAICDFPYGIGQDGKKNKSRGKLAKPVDYKGYSGGDKKTLSQEHFNEVIRVSQNQIFWGANHFISKIPFDSSCWVVWDKLNNGNDFADCEIAWTSFKSAVRKFTYRWNGMFQGDLVNGKDNHLKQVRIHHNEKPIPLYKWIFENYPCKSVIDPTMGSQSSRIAAWFMGIDYTGIDIDTDVFNEGCKRFAREKMKREIPFAKPIIQQTKFEL